MCTNMNIPDTLTVVPLAVTGMPRVNPKTSYVKDLWYLSWKHVCLQYRGGEKNYPYCALCKQDGAHPI